MITKKNISEHILLATISRPETRNAIDPEVMRELGELVTELEQNEDILVFILTGEGTDSFISGGDLIKFHTIKSQDKAEEMSRKMHHILNRIEKLPCWTIACVNGDVYGGGIETMLAFDFRLSAPSVKFGFTQGRFSLVPGWGGLTRLTENAGRAKALEWLGKSSVISANTALIHGVIGHILPGENLEKETLEWVEDLTKNDRTFIHTLKQGANHFSEAREQVLSSEIEPFAKLWVKEDHLKRVESFINEKQER
ncbi:MAG: enoyl-CoA hydratase/isomerase family protein [Balneolaceae bacterium]